MRSMGVIKICEPHNDNAYSKIEGNKINSTLIAGATVKLLF